MNKLFSAIVSAVVLFAACQKNEIAEPSRDGQVLYATIEDWSSTRTVLDEDNNIRWSEGDQIVGFLNSTLGLKYQVTASSVGQTSASFDEVGSGGLNAGTELDHIIAYYPYSSAVKVAKSGADYALEVALPYEQTYAHESFGNGSFPMVAVSQTNNITFRNVCGGMKLQLKGTAKIASIKVEGKNSEKLSGKASITAYTDASKPSIVMADDASTSAVLNCGSGVQLNQDDATDFIISLPPTVFTKGFTITVTDVNGGAQVIETSKSNTVLRSSLLKMPVVTVEITTTPQEGDYIDEYGINHGQGIEIDGVVWAPVNCGYHATDFKYGKLYQWGRKYGQGYDGVLYDSDGDEVGEYFDAITPSLVSGSVSLLEGESYSNSNFIYNGSDWLSTKNDKLWNLGVDETPIRTEYDPCPEGWRVPTYSELNQLSKHHSTWTIEGGQSGYWYCGSKQYSKDASQIFLPAAGHTLAHNYRGKGGYYWSSRPGHYYYDVSLLYFDNTTSDLRDYVRSYGFSIRCVKDEAEFVPVVSVTIDKSSLSMEVGKTETISATITPSKANHNTAFWCSDNTDVAVVDQNGNVTAIAEGTANITAMAGMQVATCIVTVTSARVPQEGDYVDEYGINHGPGIKIGETVWAPVNCGYHATDFKYGKLYQWGRKYGQGYDGGFYVNGVLKGSYSDAIVPEYKMVPEQDGYYLYPRPYYYQPLFEWQSHGNENIVFIRNVVDVPEYNYPDLWNLGDEYLPIKTEYDPCPEGWRVPTHTELDGLSQHHSQWLLDESQSGLWISDSPDSGTTVPCLFFPASGTNEDRGGNSRGRNGIYWSSSICPSRYGISYHLSLSEQHSSVGFGYTNDTGCSVRCVKSEKDPIPVDDLILNKASMSLVVRDSEVLSAAIVPSTATHTKVYWSSDNENVATVDENGNVKAVSLGTANITAMAGMKKTSCLVTVVMSLPSGPSPLKGDYVDEYGINHGQGIEIDGVVWAPVNCGYHATDFKYGKLYQWGRKYGQGYDGPIIDPASGSHRTYYDDGMHEGMIIEQGVVSVIEGNSPANETRLYKGTYENYWDWCSIPDARLWNLGTDVSPQKTEYDPCPKGWRVPTGIELISLAKNYSSSSQIEIGYYGQQGIWFSGKVPYDSDAVQIFFPYAGYIVCRDEASANRNYDGSYWSSSVEEYGSVCVCFGLNDRPWHTYSIRSNAYSVRCVRESAESEEPVM